MKISIEKKVMAPMDTVWNAWNNPDDIVQWNTASDDWHTTGASSDLRVGGKLWSRMEAKDGSMSFDFGGTYTAVDSHKLIEFVMEDSRVVRVEFIPAADGVIVRESFDAEDTFSGEQQRAGWQAILDRFARHVQAKIST
jgi:uncharacterized protein YndB with AHSA1/START domain